MSRLMKRWSAAANRAANEAVAARVLAWTTKHTPGDGSTHWSSRKLAAKLGGISHMTVTRIWAKHALRPHRLEGYLASNDPDFEAKAADVIGLYLHPPQHAAVFCVDEKTAIQALDRKDPVLPLSPGRAERHGFEYVRHGTLSLYAAFNTKTGEVLGKTVPRHTSSEFVAFLTDIVRRPRNPLSFRWQYGRRPPTPEYSTCPPHRPFSQEVRRVAANAPNVLISGNDQRKCSRNDPLF